MASIQYSSLSSTLQPSTPWTFSCCNGLKFIYVPFIGYTLITWAVPILLSLLLLSFCIPPLIRFSSSLINLGLKRPLTLSVTILILGLTLNAVSTAFLLKLDANNFSTGGVHGWSKALSMSTVDDDSPSTSQWCSSTSSLWRELEESGQGQNDVIRATAPIQVKVIEEDEAKLLAHKIRSKRDNWIHMNERAGPLPVFIYGTYWMYLSFNKPWPDRRNMREDRGKYCDINNMTEGGIKSGVGGEPKRTSNMGYGSSVKLYNEELRREFKDLYQKNFRSLNNMRWAYPDSISLTHIELSNKKSFKLTLTVRGILS
ncbi:hypothetical protein TL16_g04653 [Triparma laevis f. inornata]|uniref:Uncharacterized protein n=1 Tax=Triparma laevis f. inornata TaxID=1714386 RepID=A0A9W7E605_9STRA|nr:hypothetical protein TL16_g04653 [Triparma laevis f. inornata]